MKRFAVALTVLAVSLTAAPAGAEEVVLSGGVKGELHLVKEKTENVKVYSLTVKRGRVKETFKVYRVGKLYFAEPTAMVKEGKFFLPYPAGRVKTEVKPFSPEELSDFRRAYSSFVAAAGLREPDTGKPKLYVVFDPLCPYCERAVRSGEMKKLMASYDLRAVPFPVHGKLSERIAACLLKKAEEERAPFEKVVAEWFKDSPREKRELLNSCGQNLSKEELILRKLSRELRSLEITGTPTFIYSDGTISVGKPEAKDGR
ncbi:hypothetical protein Theam_1809 (plasmid) [Thermovibrio ammonificans HB-1]|uniref:Uncharacterized protein n=1 Tax=Thermovibrio ammonificans (strain DSM 15698 / JCM 12110 / HB-1) TaxID=648996 RepID=E8T6U2_THEA1|nr:thioredoxin fold domain-containing protein [Thermovibrio ammonificans]ADU97765.1 hypothetical protein Theam_1809 [Thermovibrio ammonificans HB-1]